jgi:hypothetical protein
MERKLLNRISDLAVASEGDVVEGLQELLSGSSDGSLTVRAARDSFTKVLARARSGDMQLIGKKLDDMAVVISLKDLAELVRSSTRGVSFGSLLEGQKPLGRRVVGERRNRSPLKPRFEPVPASGNGIGM